MVAPAVASVASGNSNSASYAVSVPVGTANGDLLIGVVASDFGTFAGNGFPAGWTALTTSTYDGGTNAFHIALYARVASSEPATYSIAQDSSDSVAAILRVTGWDSAAGIAGAVKQIAPSTTGTGTTAPSLTPFGADDLLITFHGAESSSGGSRTWTPPTGMTEDIDRQSTTWTSLEVNHLANPATPSGTKVATPSASVDTGAACTISIKAVGGGGSGPTATPTATTAVVAAPRATPSVSDAGTPPATPVVVGAPQAVPSVSDAAMPASTTSVIALPQASISGGATARPAAIGTVVAVPQASPVTAGNATATPATITAVVAAPQAAPAVAGNATASPAAITTIVALPQAARSGAATATPGQIQTVVTAPTAVPALSDAAVPATIQVITAFPQAARRGDAQPKPGPVFLLVQLYTATAGGPPPPYTSVLIPIADTHRQDGTATTRRLDGTAVTREGT